MNQFCFIQALFLVDACLEHRILVLLQENVSYNLAKISVDNFAEQIECFFNSEYFLICLFLFQWAVRGRASSHREVH